MGLEENNQLSSSQCFGALKIAPLRVVSESLRGSENRIELRYPNFRVRSPSTRFPDLGLIEVDYMADLDVVDPSSLDAYIAAYRQVTAFGEDVVNRIFDDLMAICSPRSLIVRGFFVSDENIGLKVEASTEDNPR